MGAAYRLYGVNLASLGSIIAPDGVAVLVEFSNTVLVGNEYVTVGQQYGVANLAASLLLVSPAYLSILHDEHTQALTLSGIEEVVARQTLVRLRRNGTADSHQQHR